VIGLALTLAVALAAEPLACPDGTVRRGGEPPVDFAEWCERKDAAGLAVRHGPSRTYYDDGGVWTEETFRDGVREGTFVEYHRNGRKAREGGYARGEREGRWTIWYESGVVEEESGWSAGVRDGAFASYSPSGKRKASGRHCGGPQCGRWLTFDEEGREIGSAEFWSPGR
jgi:antitoxin component YwqK of YwqJK toxin-antitoxin module